MKQPALGRIVAALSVGVVLYISPGKCVLAQQKPNSTPEDGLPLPGPAAPEQVINADGSITSTSQWGRGTKAETRDKNGNLVSTIYTTPQYDGGQTQTVEAGTVNITTDTDSRGHVTRLQKMDSSTATRNVFEYDENGQLVKASIFRSQTLGEKEQPREIYEAQNTPSGSPERFNETTNRFERIPASDWQDILDRLHKSESEIQESRNHLTPDPLEKERMEAAKHPMGEEPQPPDRPGGEGSAPPISPPKPRDGLALPSNPLTYDPCLLGTWEATSYQEASGYGVRGGTGFRVTFTRDDQGLIETVDYSNMQNVLVGNDPDPYKYRGSASARIVAKDGSAKIDQMQSRGVTFSYRSVPPMPLPTLGPAGLGSAAGSTAYVCTNETLEYQSTAARDRHPNTTIKLSRVK